jgi:hypothetical protein
VPRVTYYSYVMVAFNRDGNRERAVRYLSSLFSPRDRIEIVAAIGLSLVFGCLTLFAGIISRWNLLCSCRSLRSDLC